MALRADWQNIQAPDTNSSFNYWAIEHVGSTGQAWIVGDSGFIVKSTNGFDDLNQAFNRSGAYGNLYNLHFHDANTGWVVGAAGAILKTTDGFNFSPQSSGTAKPITGIDFVPGNASIGWVVAYDPGGSELRYTTNGGADWTLLGVGPAFFAVDVIDADHRCFVGDNGSIATIDFGVYSTRSSGTTSNLWDVKFNSTSVGIAVGANGTILKTTDGGVTWARKNSGSPRALFGVDYSRNFSSQWIAVGEGGTILSSTDEGETWFLTASGTGATIRDVAFKGLEIGVAHVVTQGAGILRTATLGGSYPGISVTSGGVPYVEEIDTFDFGMHSVGSVVDRTFTIRNTGTTNLVVGSHGISGGGLQFSMTDRLAPAGTDATLAPSEERTVTVRYRPSTEGTIAAFLTFASNAPGAWTNYSINLSGTGTAGPIINVSQGAAGIADEGTFAFGDQSVGRGASTRLFTITNSGQGTLSDLAISSQGADAGDFAFTAPLQTSLTNGQSTTFSVTFTPSALGQRNAEIRITSNISDFAINPNPFNFSISGNGILPPTAPVVAARGKYNARKRTLLIRGAATDVNSDLASISLRNGRKRSPVAWRATSPGATRYVWRSRVRLRSKRSTLVVQAIDRSQLRSIARKIRVIRKGS